MDYLRKFIPVLLLALPGTGILCGQATQTMNENFLRVAEGVIPVSMNVDANLAAIKRGIDFAGKERADILLTPEGSLSGYTSEFDQERVMDALEEITSYAQEAGVGLALGVCIYEKGYDKPLNQIRFYNREGAFLGAHSKILRCTNMKNPQPGNEEVDRFATTDLKTFRVKGLTVGGLVCNDLWATPDWTSMPDPFLVQQLSTMGAVIIFHASNTGSEPGEWGQVYRQFHGANIRLRALTGKVWIVSVNAVPENNAISNSQSGILSPEGKWVVEADDTGEQFLIYSIPIKQ